MVGIYKITNPKGSIYIGQSWNIDDRVKYYAKHRCKNQNKLYNSIQKYGWELHSFEIISVLPKDVFQEVLDQYETIYWMSYKETGHLMLNLREPGSRGKHSLETRTKMSELKKKEFKEEPDRFNTFKNATIGRSKSQEEIDKWKISRLKSMNSKPPKRGEDHWHYGKPSPKKGTKLSPEIVEKARNGMKHLMKAIAMYDLNDNHIMNFDSIKEAARHLNTCDSHIRQHLKGISSRVYGYKFKII